MHSVENLKLLTTEDVSREIDVSPAQVRRWVSEGKMPRPTRIAGRAFVWSAEAIEPWIRSYNMVRAVVKRRPKADPVPA